MFHLQNYKNLWLRLCLHISSWLSCYDFRNQLLLGYLPSSHDLWETQLEENRKKYADMKEELLLNPVIYFWFVQFSQWAVIFILNICVIAPAFQFSLITLLNLRQSEHIWKEPEDLSSTQQHEDNDADGPLRRHEISVEDHPLSLDKESLWRQYFQVS
jgi:hypothetical protein